jgi:sulfatase maturation enzyme AslB (radical SAM superfamily)
MNEFYCAAPWRSLHINVRSEIKTCCAGRPSKPENLNNITIEAALNSPELTEIRKTLRQGIPHSYCVNCVDSEKKGAVSEREWHNGINPGFDITHAGDNYEFPALLDIRWNSTCTLSCNYCGPHDSSMWSAIKKIPIKTSTRKYYEEVCEFIAKNKYHVKEAALIGGEPLLLPENERLLDVLPEDCAITVITNLSNPLGTNKIFKKLAQRKNVRWNMSFDNIGSRFEYVRHGGKWDTILHSLDIIQPIMNDAGREHSGGINSVYNLYNATRLCEFKQFATDRGLAIHWNHLVGSSALDPFRYGTEIAGIAASEIEKFFATCDPDSSEIIMFTAALKHYRSKIDQNPGMFEKLHQFVLDIEDVVHPDTKGQFSKLWPEIAIHLPT